MTNPTDHELNLGGLCDEAGRNYVTKAEEQQPSIEEKNLQEVQQLPLPFD